jgi:hypothetical protein
MSAPADSGPSVAFATKDHCNGKANSHGVRPTCLGRRAASIRVGAMLAVIKRVGLKAAGTEPDAFSTGHRPGLLQLVQRDLAHLELAELHVGLE